MAAAPSVWYPCRSGRRRGAGMRRWATAGALLVAVVGGLLPSAAGADTRAGSPPATRPTPPLATRPTPPLATRPTPQVIGGAPVPPGRWRAVARLLHVDAATGRPVALCTGTLVA